CVLGHAARIGQSAQPTHAVGTGVVSVEDGLVGVTDLAHAVQCVVAVGGALAARIGFVGEVAGAIGVAGAARVRTCLIHHFAQAVLQVGQNVVLQDLTPSFGCVARLDPIVWL